MKKCTLCKTIKPESEFWHRSRNSQNLCPRCKDCMKAAHHTHYRQHLTEYRQRQREYGHKRKLAGWKTIRSPEQQDRYNKRVTKFYKEHADRQFAKASVREAAKRGERIIRDVSVSLRIKAHVLLKYPFCPLCGKPTSTRSLHGHHHRGYGKPLDVLFICQECHGAITAMERLALLEGLPAIAGLARFIKEKRQMAEKSDRLLQNQPLRECNIEVENCKQETRHAS